MNPLFTFPRTVDLLNPFRIGWVFPEFVLKIKQTLKVGARDLVKGSVKLTRMGLFGEVLGKQELVVYLETLWITGFADSLDRLGPSSVVAECWADPSF